MTNIAIGTETARLPDSGLTELCHFFRAAAQRGRRLVLATIVRTAGSTYRKAGAKILLAECGTRSGLISGGCMEADLLERALQVSSRQRPARVVFDTRGIADDSVFGLGMGCEGTIDILLQPTTPENGFGPLPYLCKCLDQGREGILATVIGGDATSEELGRIGYSGQTSDDPLSICLAALDADSPRIESVSHDQRILDVFIAPVALPPALLLCGGGADAIPVAQFADALGWRVTVHDHRPAYAKKENFPAATRVILGRPAELSKKLSLAQFDAAVIMSHHLGSDVEYLRQLAELPPFFIGILGPAARRARLFAEVAPQMHALVDRIHGPVGLDIGANSPASIALAIVAQIHALLAGRRCAK